MTIPHFCDNRFVRRKGEQERLLAERIALFPWLKYNLRRVDPWL
jgi:hypothetical protein